MVTPGGKSLGANFEDFKKVVKATEEKVEKGPAFVAVQARERLQAQKNSEQFNYVIMCNWDGNDSNFHGKGGKGRGKGKGQCKWHYPQKGKRNDAFKGNFKAKGEARTTKVMPRSPRFTNTARASAGSYSQRH